MRVLAEMGLLLVLGLALAWLVGLRSDGVFIAGLLLAVSVAGLVEWLRPAQWSWVLCTAYLVIAVAVPSWCAFMPLIAYDTARLPALASTGARAGARTAASGRSPSVSRTAASRRSLADAMRSAPWLSAAARWIWVLPLIALWFARGTDRLQTLVMTDYPKLAPIVKKAYGAFEADLAKRQAAFEKDYVKTVKTNPKAAQKALDAFSIKAMTDAENLTEDLMNQLFTVRTEDIQKVNFFANRSKKD